MLIYRSKAGNVYQMGTLRGTGRQLAILVSVTLNEMDRRLALWEYGEITSEQVIKKGGNCLPPD